MEKNRIREIIIELLQETLKGKLDPSTNFNPNFLAEAIMTKVDFEKPYGEIMNEKLIESLTIAVSELEKEMDEEYENLEEQEKLLKNFVRGKLHAYKEVIDVIRKL